MNEEESKKTTGTQPESGSTGEMRPRPKVSEPKPPQKVPYDQTWIGGKSEEELADLVVALVMELKARAKKETERMAIDNVSTFVDISAEVDEFVRLPTASTRKAGASADVSWRIVLYASNLDFKPLGLEIHDVIAIGREAEGKSIDLDLTKFGAEEEGVSRRHAMIRPTGGRLMLDDLGSANGTYHNKDRLKLGEPHELKDQDTIAFSNLKFKIRIVSGPEKPAK